MTESLTEFLSAEEWALERELCRRSVSRFINRHVQLADKIAAADAGQLTDAGWRPFRLWPAQEGVLAELIRVKLGILLKARQLGMTWLCLALALHELIFNPGCEVLLFSSRQDEAKDLLLRLRDMYDRLPEGVRGMKGGKARRGRDPDNTKVWKLPSGSTVRCFPGKAGRSYTASMVIIDEADHLVAPADLSELLKAVKPTVDAGGRMYLVSSVNKLDELSRFKAIWHAAVRQENGFVPVFLPWHARPGRTQGWYDAEQRRILAETGSLDELWSEYPATAEEALAPSQSDKRIPSAWLVKCFEERGPCEIPFNHYPGCPAVPGLTVYAIPRAGRRYGCGSDPAEGNPTSDESCSVWQDAVTGEEVAVLAGRFQPAQFADYTAQVSRWLNNAAVLVERNNHGHAVILWLNQNASHLAVMTGPDSRQGWLTNQKGKALLWSAIADAAKAQEVTIHDKMVFFQLCSIDGSTLRAPEGQHDDRAVASALAVLACLRLGRLMPFEPFSV